MNKDRIIWVDPHNDRECSPEVVGCILELIQRDPHATIRVFVIPRLIPSQILEWNAIVTSPRGLRNLSITQRKPGGAVKFAAL